MRAVVLDSIIGLSCHTKKGSTPFLYESARAEIQLGVTGNMLSTTLTK